jgi:heterodisulfide reductase subunit A-like polyferredoxin
LGSVLILGGGIAGIQAALNLSQTGIETFLVEREEELGGNLKNLGSTFPEGKQASDLIENKVKEIRSSQKATIITGAELSSITGERPDFKATLKTSKGTQEVECESIIVATGFKPFDPASMKHYGFGKYEDVITALNLARMIKDGKLSRNSNGKEPASVTFIQCIGSRDLHTHTYCSSFCCMYAVHLATVIKEKYPQCILNILYMDIRTPFCAELNYEEARRRGVKFYRSKPAKIRAGEGRKHLTIQFEDTLDGKLRFLNTEMVVLSIGASSPEGTDSLASLLKIDCEESGFFKCEQSPVFTKVKGVFIAGSASGPKDISSCLAEGSAAAAQAAILLKE